MELNQAWLDAHLGPDTPRLLEARMNRAAEVVEEGGG